VNINCVLFDLDGVLVDACEWHYISLNRALSSVLGFEITRADHIEKYNGLPTSVKLKMLGVDPATAKQIEQLKQSITLSLIQENAKVMQEKIELHSYLKSHNIKIACVTNSIYTTASTMLRMTGQIDYMDLIVSNEDVSKNKPHPDCYNFAVEKLGVDPIRCLCVEDSPKGIAAARSSVIPNLWIVENPLDVNLDNYREIVK
jgi:beta-phosphoglucomutase